MYVCSELSVRPLGGIDASTVIPGWVFQCKKEKAEDIFAFLQVATSGEIELE